MEVEIRLADVRVTLTQEESVYSQVCSHTSHGSVGR